MHLIPLEVGRASASYCCKALELQSTMSFNEGFCIPVPLDALGVCALQLSVCSLGPQAQEELLVGQAPLAQSVNPSLSVFVCLCVYLSVCVWLPLWLPLTMNLVAHLSLCDVLCSWNNQEFSLNLTGWLTNWRFRFSGIVIKGLHKLMTFVLHCVLTCSPLCVCVCVQGTAQVGLLECENSTEMSFRWLRVQTLGVGDLQWPDQGGLSLSKQPGGLGQSSRTMVRTLYTHTHM